MDLICQKFSNNNKVSSKNIAFKARVSREVAISLLSPLLDGGDSFRKAAERELKKAVISHESIYSTYVSAIKQANNANKKVLETLGQLGAFVDRTKKNEPMLNEGAKLIRQFFKPKAVSELTHVSKETVFLQPVLSLQDEKLSKFVAGFESTGLESINNRLIRMAWSGIEIAEKSKNNEHREAWIKTLSNIVFDRNASKDATIESVKKVVDVFPEKREGRILLDTVVYGLFGKAYDVIPHNVQIKPMDWQTAEIAEELLEKSMHALNGFRLLDKEPKITKEEFEKISQIIKAAHNKGQKLFVPNADFSQRGAVENSFAKRVSEKLIRETDEHKQFDLSAIKKILGEAKSRDTLYETRHSNEVASWD